MNKCIAIIFGILIFFILGCSSTEEGKLAKYIKNIPEDEAINASLYNYELMVSAAEKAYTNGDYQQVLDIYEQYEEVFFESPITDESELIYWLGLSLVKIFDYPENTATTINTNFFNYLNANRKRKNLFAIQFEGKYVSNKNGVIYPTRMYYEGKHFFDIINQRVDYELEKKALRQIYLEKFTNITKNTQVSKNNFKQLYWIVTRYPSFFTLEEYQQFKNKYLITNQLKKAQQEQLARMDAIITIEAGDSIISDSDFSELTKNQICFPVSESIVVYNRTERVASRNLASLELWEPFKILASLRANEVESEDDFWYKIQFKNQQKGYIDKAAYVSSCGSDVVNEPEWENIKTDYFKVYKDYLNKDYLKVVDKLSEILYNFENKTQENIIFTTRLWTFFYLNLNAIAVRSTSLNNPFTVFTIEHSDYFEVSKDQINLEVTDYFLKKVIELNPKSPMLQYFEGFN